MSLFLELIIVLLCMLMVETKMFYFGEELTKGLDNATITAEAKYAINFAESGKRFLLSWHYNGNNSFLFVNAVKMYQFQAKDSETKTYPLYLGNILKDFKLNNMKKNRLKQTEKFFFVDDNAIDTSDISDIHRYLMKEA